MQNVWAIVVTFNRRDLLRECVAALLLIPDLKILVVDNASSDGTEALFHDGAEFANPRIVYIRLKANEGGAGGFYWGTRLAVENGAEWVWLMDDDVEPLPGSLDALLLQTGRRNVGFVCSCVRAPDHAISMNLPRVADTAALGQYPTWDEWLSEGLVKVKAATFVSVLISRKAVEKCGFPNRKFFIWGDDFEYTQRITDAGFTGIMVGSSVVLHKRAQLEALSIVTEENLNRVRMMINLYRNTVWTRLRERSFRALLKVLALVIEDMSRVVARSKNHRLLRLGIILRGASEGVFRNLSNNQEWKASDAVAKSRGCEVR